MKSVSLMFGFAAASIVLTATNNVSAGDCSSSRKTVMAMPTSGGSTGNIVETAIRAGNFNTLVAAVKAADLVDTLSSPGPFTVFAPTDEAFAKLPKGTLTTLLANPDQLAAILRYHVVAGEVKAADVVKLSSARTALGQSIRIETSNGVRVGKANVIKTDIETSNGVIHVIDTVLLPENDIIEAARSAGSFKTLLAAIDAAGLTDTLRGAGPFTVFAPTDDAFAKLPQGTVEVLLNDTPKLTSILTYHVVSGKVLASDVVKLNQAETLLGQTVRIDTTSGVKIDDARVVKTDVMADNGVIHVIDSVLLPASSSRSSADPAAAELIRQAISRGAPMYNDGHPEACAAVYEVAVMGLLARSDGSLREDDREALSHALVSMRQTHNSGKQAWIMRHALDEVYESVAPMTN